MVKIRRIPIGIFLALSFYIIYLGTKKDPVRDDKGNMILRYNKLYIFTGAIAIAIAPMIISNVLFTGYPETRDYIIGGLLPLILLLLAALLILMYINERVVIGSNSIEYRSIFRRTIKTDWKDIKKIRHNPTTRKLMLITENTSIGISTNFVGFKVFAEEVTRHAEIVS